MNEHTIKLIEGKQPPYGPIYALSSVELETFKTYIKTYLKTGFIEPSKSPTWALILFDKKFDGSLHLCVDYWGLNNLIIENWYPLPLIGEVLDCLGRAKRFTQLDHLTSAYYWMGFEKVMSRKRPFAPGTGTSNIRLCPLVYQTHQLVFKATSIRSLLRNLISLLWCIWIISWSISRTSAGHT